MQRALIALAAIGIAFAGALPASAADKPTDPQIAHIAYTAGLIDIEAGKQAIDKAQNKDVRAFAQRLTKSAEETRTKLAGLDDAAFDKAYVDNEVAYHKTVNDALSKTLIPSAQNAELKALLEKGLSLFQAHQNHAEELAKQLQ